MKRTALILSALFLPAVAAAQTYLAPRPLETLDDAYRRQETNRYLQDRATGGQPLGGYQQRLGDPPVRQQPSYGSPFAPTPYGQPQPRPSVR